MTGEPLEAIDAQLEILGRARSHMVAALMLAEQDAVAALTDPSVVDRAGVLAADARTVLHDFNAIIDELQTERELIVPRPRWPLIG